MHVSVCGGRVVGGSAVFFHGHAAGVSGRGCRCPLWVHNVWCPLWVHIVWCPLWVHNVWSLAQKRRTKNKVRHMPRTGQNYIYTVYVRYFWQGNHQIQSHIRCIFTVPANPTHVPSNQPHATRNVLEVIATLMLACFLRDQNRLLQLRVWRVSYCLSEKRVTGVCAAAQFPAQHLAVK